MRGAHLHVVTIDDVFPSYDKNVTVLLTDDEDPGELIDSSGRTVMALQAVPPTRLIFQVSVDRTPPVIWQFDVVQE